jgi:hypothetical protein
MLLPVPIQLFLLQLLLLWRMILRCWWTFAFVPPLWIAIYVYRKHQDEIETKKLIVRDCIGIFALWLFVLMLVSRSSIFYR